MFERPRVARQSLLNEIAEPFQVVRRRRPRASHVSAFVTNRADREGTSVATATRGENSMLSRKISVFT